MLIAPFILAKRFTIQALWVKQILLASALYLSLPIVNALTSDKN
jgi:hypothetical protein